MTLKQCQSHQPSSLLDKSVIMTSHQQQSKPDSDTKQAATTDEAINESVMNNNYPQTINTDYNTFILNIIHYPNGDYKSRMTEWEHIIQLIWDYKCDCDCKVHDTACLCSFDYWATMLCNNPPYL